MRPLVIGALILFLIGTGAEARAQDDSGQDEAFRDAPADTSLTRAQEGSWLTRTMRRYFGSSSQLGDELQGGAVEIVDAYEPYVGKNIAVILVYQVTRFENYWDERQGTTDQLFHAVTQPFQSYTKDRLIRDYLLFEQGQALDPFLLGDSERMLRNLDFINDARISVVPLQGEPGSVVVIVETRDKWPFGVSGRIKDVDRYDIDLYFSNIAGYGVRLNNRAIYRGDMEPNLGYQGGLRKDNVAGTFIDLRLLYEDSWQQLSRQAGIQRTLIYPRIKWVGGADWQYTDVRDNAGIPQKYELGDYWLGHTIRLKEKGATSRKARPVLVPAVRLRQIDYKVRPVATADTNVAYLNTIDYLAGLTYQRLRYYKTSYLFRMGETENVPAGITLKLSGGYQDREVYGRTGLFAQAHYMSVRPQGEFFYGVLDIGGYFHDRVLEDGAFNAGGVYITRLSGGGRYRHRFYTTLFYTLAFNRDFGEALVLGDRTGLRGLDDNLVRGNQRLVLKLESRLFTPWTLMGFRFMVFGYADIGAVGGEKEVLVQQKVYSSVGLGFRINNPDLDLDSTEIRIGFLNSVEENGVIVGFKFGRVDYTELDIPSTRPGPFEFN